MGYFTPDLAEYRLDESHLPKNPFRSRTLRLRLSKCQAYQQAARRSLREFGWEQSAKVILFVDAWKASSFITRIEMMNHKNPEFRPWKWWQRVSAKDAASAAADGGAVKHGRREFEADLRALELEQEISVSPAVRR